MNDMSILGNLALWQLKFADYPLKVLLAVSNLMS